MTRRTILWVSVPLAALLLAALLGRGPVSSADELSLRVHYALRGVRQADTSIIVVYIDQDAIKPLGWPVRRNFHALMIHALQDLHPSVIGIEPVFEDPKPEYAEYDELLGRMIGSAGNVVLTAYVDSVGEPGSPVRDTVQLPLPEYSALLYHPPGATGPHLPLPLIGDHAAGIGHVNVAGPSTVDPFLAVGQGVLPAFSFELIRVYNRTPATGVASDGGRILYRGNSAHVASVTGAVDGRLLIDYPGGLPAFRAYPFLEVLRSYDNLRADRPAGIPVAAFRDKIVLVGIIAEGRSGFLSTAASTRLPAILYHAAVVDNALNGRFLGTTPFWLTLIVTLLAGLASGWVGSSASSPLKRVILVAFPFAWYGFSYACFAWMSAWFPFLLPAAAAAVAGAGGLLERYGRDRVQVDQLTVEKRAILEQLHDREAKVAMLEQELASMESARETERSGRLFDELKKYREEIRSLSSQAEDMDAYEPASAELKADEFEGIIFDPHGPMKDVVSFVTKVAASEAPVLILGESGTGKELIARAVHRRSGRGDRSFVAVNCGALAESLLESELFGHEKGAFTGAVKDRLGRFEIAEGGTILLDEIGEVSEGFQLKLLRVLQEGEFERVGGTKTIKTNVRVIAATNKDLRAGVREKKFREDLFYRLNVLTVNLPALRDRGEDIRLLAESFLRKQAGELRMSRNVMEVLRAHSWPGNIRELESAITRGGVMARAEGRALVTLRDLPDDIAAAARKTVPVEDQVLDAVREKGFSRSSVTTTADELGGLNRGTVAEYLRGECLKMFAEAGFDMEKAVKRISLSPDREINERVRKRLLDYLENIAAVIEKEKPWVQTRDALKPKTKNLPQKYHPLIEKVGEAFYRGLWRLPE
jgi:transcriptional regulator with GAF, ATPase, and Fis domain/CHASE2 domain-containing sensor protein